MAIEFYKHQDLWGLLKKINARGAFESQAHFLATYMVAADKNGDNFSFRRAMLEQAWETRGRPYYNVFPAILPMLMSIKLDIPCSMLESISVEPIEIRLPTELEDCPLCWAEGRVRSVLVGIQPMPKEVGSEELIPGLCVCFDIGERDELDHPIMAFKFFPLRDDMSIEDSYALFPEHESMGKGVHIPNEVIVATVKLCACLALIDQDSDIITPDILAKDRDRWQNASEADKQRMADMARRRGKSGWDVGASIERVPHYRRPHPALVRVGKGRTLTRIVMRKGSVVHRGKLTSIPTGFSAEADEA